MEAEYTQQGHQHTVLLTCDTNELMTLIGLVGEAGGIHPARVLGPKATAQDYEIYDEALPKVLRCMHTVLQRIDHAAAHYAVRNQHTA